MSAGSKADAPVLQPFGSLRPVRLGLPPYDLLFEKQEHLKLRHLFEYARALGLGMARFTAKMNDEIYLQRVREHQQSGDASGVRATPTFFVNGSLVDVSYGLHALLDAVEAAPKAIRPGPSRGILP